MRCASFPWVCHQWDYTVADDASYCNIPLSNSDIKARGLPVAGTRGQPRECS